MPTICISIINFCTPEMTLACLRSVLDDLKDIDGHVVIVDNASGDNSLDALQNWMDAHPEAPVSLVASATNSGFSGGHNQGMTACPADFYLILNSDALIRPGFFRLMLEAARKAPDAGLFAPTLIHEDDIPQISSFRFPSIASEFIRGANSGPVSRLLNRWVMSLGTDPDETEIGWASFACILLKGAMTQQIGPMDEGYFLYFEDAEYCMRARAKGWPIVRVPDAKVVHFRGGSSSVKSQQAVRKRLPAYYYRSRARFLAQAYGRFGPVLGNVAWTAGRLVALSRVLVGKRPNPIVEKEPRDIWIGALAPMKAYRP